MASWVNIKSKAATRHGRSPEVVALRPRCGVEGVAGMSILSWGTRVCRDTHTSFGEPESVRSQEPWRMPLALFVVAELAQLDHQRPRDGELLVEPARIHAVELIACAVQDAEREAHETGGIVAHAQQLATAEEQHWSADAA